MRPHCLDVDNDNDGVSPCRLMEDKKNRNNGDGAVAETAESMMTVRHRA